MDDDDESASSLASDSEPEQETVKIELPDGFLECFKQCPRELFYVIFSYVPLVDLLEYRGVCKEWNEMITGMCYRFFKGAGRASSIHISPRLAPNGDTLFKLSRRPLRNLNERCRLTRRNRPAVRKHKRRKPWRRFPVFVPPEALRICIVPFFNKSYFEIYLDGLPMQKAIESLSTLMKKLGETIPIEVTEFFITNCPSKRNSSINGLQEFLTSPHCKNLRKFELEIGEGSVLPKKLCVEDVLRTLPVSLRKSSVSFPPWFRDKKVSDAGLLEFAAKGNIRKASFKHCTKITAEGVVRAVEALFSVADRKLASGEREEPFSRRDLVKLRFLQCSGLRKRALQTAKRPKGDANDNPPYSWRGEALVMAYRSISSGLRVNVYVS